MVNRVAEDLTMTEAALFQTPSPTTIDLLTEEMEAEAVVDMATTKDGQWITVSQERDSKEEVTVDQMVSNMVVTVRESTTVTASTAIKKVTLPSTAVLLQDQEVNMVVDLDTMEAAAAAEVKIIIGEKDKVEIDKVEKIDNKTTLMVSDPVDFWYYPAN
tara:strand:- start:134 stop:610 length:477 start_codon:yes stop_codon:yes gene_type:complete